MRIGITGHQRLPSDTHWDWVIRAAGRELDRLPPHPTAINWLAVGADQVLARLILSRGGSLHAVLPYADIERSFAPADLPAFRQLLQAATVEVLHTPGTPEDAYLAAGKRVVDLSDLLLAVWDGHPAKGKGGTAEVVAYARGKRVKTIHLEPMTSTCVELGGVP